MDFTKAVWGVAVASGASVLLACTDDQPAVPRAYVTSAVIPGNDPATNGSEKCNISSGDQWVTIVSAQNTSVNDGDSLNGVPVTVQCTVSADGTGFAVDLDALLHDRNAGLPGSVPTGGGSVQISGHFTASGQQAHVKASFVRADTGSFTSSDCTVDYPDAQSIGPGRIRGTLNCPLVTSTSTMGRACSAHANFIFEHCTT